MDEFKGGKALIYKSDNIFERRRRILHEARKIIADSDVASFSVRELCARAGIAQKTLYNAFGSKENVIALAIKQYLDDFHTVTQYRRDPLTIEGGLERLIKLHQRNTEIRPYTTAIMGVYNSPTADKSIRQAMRNMGKQSAQLFYDTLAKRGGIAPGVSPESYHQIMSTALYAVLTDWCLGDLSNDELIDRMCEKYLMVLIGVTRGAVQREAQRWLDDLRSKGEAWLALRRQAQEASGKAKPTARRKRAPAKI